MYNGPVLDSNWQSRDRCSTGFATEDHRILRGAKVNCSGSNTEK